MRDALFFVLGWGWFEMFLGLEVVMVGFGVERLWFLVGGSENKILRCQ